MMGIVVGIFSSHQVRVDAAVVSVVPILEVRDSLEVFEFYERVIILRALRSASGSFGTEEFHGSFRDRFLSNIYDNDITREFIFENLTVAGIVIDEDAKNFDTLDKAVYPKSASLMSSDQFVFERSLIGKEFLMKVEDNNNINFPFRFNFEYERKYLITYVDGDYVIEEIEN